MASWAKFFSPLAVRVPLNIRGSEAIRYFIRASRRCPPYPLHIVCPRRPADEYMFLSACYVTVLTDGSIPQRGCTSLWRDDRSRRHSATPCGSRVERERSKTPANSAPFDSCYRVVTWYS